MIIFEQIRSATVKLIYDGVTFMIDPWLADACTEEEKARVLAEHRFIEKPVCPLLDSQSLPASGTLPGPP